MTRLHSRSLRIIVADGDFAIRTELESALEAACFDVVASAATCRGAIAEASNRQVDAILMSADFVDDDPLLVAAQFQYERIGPVVLLASKIDRTLIRKASDVELFSILPKPVNIANLIPAIEIAHGSWSAKAEAERRLRSLKEREQSRELIDAAKRLLMSTRRIGEDQAYRILRTSSMNTRKPMGSIARAVLDAGPANKLHPDVAGERQFSICLAG